MHFEVREDGAKNRRGLATGTQALSSSAAVDDLIRLSVFPEGDFLPTEPSPSLDFSVNHGVHGCSRPSSQDLCHLLHKHEARRFLNRRTWDRTRLQRRNSKSAYHPWHKSFVCRMNRGNRGTGKTPVRKQR